MTEGLDAASPGRLVELGIRRPRTVLWVAGLLTIIAAGLFVRLQVDTDPENMLPSDHPVREANADLRERFGTGDVVVLALINDDGVLTDESGPALIGLEEQIAAVDGVDADRIVGVGSTGLDGTDTQALRLAVTTNPLLAGTVLTDDGSTASWFIPIEDSDEAAEIADDLEALVDADPTLRTTRTEVAGLPLAQDAFGSQMFVQMAIFAPLAGALVFALLWFTLRSLRLVVPAMVLAVLSVVWTMGLLIGTGNTVHIMSSMIPIFLMPIAILDSVHVLSEVHDHNPHRDDASSTIRSVYAQLRRPLLFTTLTTSVGFASLALADIPPVQVFGLFIAVGVTLAYLLTMIFLPAWLTLFPPVATTADADATSGRLAAALARLGRAVVRRRRAVLAGFALSALAAVPLITTIEINDNPVNWFRSDHPVRQASTELNERLPGTFGADLVLSASPDRLADDDVIEGVNALQGLWNDLDPVGNTITYSALVDPGAPDPSNQLTTAVQASPLAASLITPELDHADLRLFLRNGDNQSMQAVVDATDDLLAQGALPDDVTATWAGESYLNLVWQDEMVTGMLHAFLSTLGIIVVLLAVLLRSVRWTVLTIAPVLWTITVVYGLIGLVGKSYDMPIAVLSTLVLGLGVDFAIHFVERFRTLRPHHDTDVQAIAAFFGEPARALTRNALVLAIGFTPLFLSSLTPYLVVGAFLASILLLSWIASIVALPAAVVTGLAGRQPPDDGEAPLPRTRAVDRRSPLDLAPH